MSAHDQAAGAPTQGAPQSPGPEGDAPSGPTCSCGRDRYHYMVSPEPQYTGLDWVWVILGITTIPFEVRFRCRTCGETFDRTRDPAEMRRHI